MFKKNILFAFIITLIFIIILYFLTFFYTKFVVDFSNLELIKHNNQISFIEKYQKRLHHLRYYKDKYLDFTDPKNLLFYSEKNNKPDQKSVLLLGDSWFNQLLSYKLSKDLLKNYLKENNLNGYNGGISSYSPSLMLLQYKILIEDFKLKPNYLIIYIDQHDFSDEVCRYKNNQYFRNNQLWAIRDFLVNPRLVNVSKIEKENIPIIFKEIKKFNYFLKERLSLAYNKSKKIFKRNKNVYGCSKEKAYSYLTKPTVNDLDYFKKTINRFLDYVYSDGQIEKILIVTFPHRNHLKNVTNLSLQNEKIDILLKPSKAFKIDVGDIVKEYLTNKDKKKIQHLNFRDLIEKNTFKIEKKDFMDYDFYSHLIEESHLRFSGTIIKKLKSMIN